MHPVRQSILFRWALYVLVVVGLAAFLLTHKQKVPTYTSDVVKRLAPKPVQLPDPAVVKTLDSAIAVLKGERVPFGGVDRVEPSLITQREEVTATGQKKLLVSISAIFMGPPKKFAIINGIVLEEGDKLPDGRAIKEIQADGVVLGVGEVSERFEWLPSFRVELKKAASITQAVSAPPAKTDAKTQESAPVNIQNLPDNPSPEQALNVLQQLKKQQQPKQQ